MRNFLTGLVACAVVLCAGYGLASRNSVGTMSAASGPYVSGTVINVSQVNARFSDIENELTDSLSRSGKGGMTAALKVADGTVAAPSFSFTTEPGSGLYRIGASDYGFAVGGVKTHEWTSTGESITGTLNVSGATTLTSDLTLTLSGTATEVPITVLKPSLAAGNILQFALGASSSGNGAATYSYIPNATAALSTNCIGVVGNQTTLCVDGSAKTTLAGALAVTGATTLGTLNTTGAATVNTLTVTTGPASIGGVSFQPHAGTCVLNGASPSTCTVNIGSGTSCTANTSSGTPAALGTTVTGGPATLTVTGPNASVQTVSYVCL